MKGACPNATDTRFYAVPYHILQIAVAVSIVIGVIVYRISVMSALHMRDEEILYKNASLVTTATAACINLVFIFILNFVSILKDK